ncbi:lipase A [Legionella quinlivanii]|uniref:Lipase A n=1 Tax=Legionella quinlivanii TaxID=45073 RepID=A0A0W0XSI4_9GAMM|nr:alpha/beta hydrolase [Legionella quinlivanii]KTD47407.1 lipase A [Legionella quinlivanii]MCW8451710.1 alpha/beta hydrolase [Legionella quinlivanii]SEG38291.1 Pimeloyl-ACP methyl ester carboxylesterase [Legionella quinlivanii DSM 21216]STY10034.1 lipase A [Legionella quinlivanii]
MDNLYFDIPGFQIAGRTWGDKSLPPLLCLHGWLDNANSFEPLAPFLSEKFYVIAVDLPGHGLSSHLPDGYHYHFSDGIFTVYQIIKQLGYEKIHLLGHSMGACLASLAAGVLTENILSSVLIEGLGPLSSSEETCSEQLSNYIKRSLYSPAKAAKPYPSLELAAQARAQNGHLPIEYARILCQRGVDEQVKGYYWRHDRKLIHPTPLRMTEGQVLSCLKEIISPSYLIWADNGFGFPKEAMEKRVQAVKGIQVQMLSGGHHIHMENPETVAKAMQSFYKSLE